MTLRKDLAATLVTYPPQAPTTLTAVLVTPSTVRVAVTATIDPVSTTVSAAAGGADTITVGSATGILAGRKYRCTRQVVQVREVDGTTLILQEPLAVSVEAGDPLVGLAASVDLTSVHTEDVGFGYVEWTSDLDVWTQTFEITRQTAEAYTLRGPELTQRLPMVRDFKDPEDDDFSEAIRAGWYLLRRDLTSQQIDISLIRSWAELEDAHAHATALVMIRQSTRVEEDFKDEWSSYYLAAKTAAFASRSTWYDADDDFDRDQGETGILVRKGWSR